MTTDVDVVGLLVVDKRIAIINYRLCPVPHPFTNGLRVVTAN